MEKDKDMFADFSERFYALMQEADEYGIHSLVVLFEQNPIGKTTISHVMHQGGGFPVALGLAKIAEIRLSERFLSPETNA